MTPLDFDPDDTASRVRVHPLERNLERVYNRHGDRICSVLGCSRPFKSLNRCGRHAYRLRKRMAS